MTHLTDTKPRQRARRLPFGSIVQDKRGRYTIRYTVQTPAGAKRMTGGRVSFRTKTEARQRLNEIESELRRGTWRDPDASKGPLLSEYAPPWIASRRSNKTKKPLAVRTRELYEDLFRLHIDPFLGHLRLAEITVDHVREWNTGRVAVAPTRARQAYALLRSILRTALDFRIVVSSPCTIVGAGSNVPRAGTYTRRADLRRLLDAVPPYLRLPLEVSAACHVRQGELLALRRGDVDLEREELHVIQGLSRARGGEVLGTTKTGESRKLTIPPATMEKLRAHLGADPHSRPDDFLFWHPSGRKLSREQINFGWRQARRSTGLTQYRWHDLRGAGLTWLSEEGMPLRYLMSRAGHSDERTALRYQSHDPDQEREMVRRWQFIGAVGAVAAG